MRNKKRLLSGLLAFVMVVAMLPTALFADTPAMSGEFDTSVKTGEGGTATMSVAFEGIDSYTTYRMLIDWTDLDGHASVKKRNVWNEQDGNLAGFITGASSGANAVTGVPITDTMHELHCVSNTPISDLSGALMMEFDVEDSIPAGYYDVEILVSELNDDADSKYVAPNMQSTWLHATATLTVLNADGSLPDTQQPAFSFDINKGVTANGTITVANDATKGTEGQTIEFTATPNANYQVDAVSVTKVAGGDVLVSGGNENPDGSRTYQFVMPGEAVTINAGFEPKSAGAYTINPVVTSGSNTGRIDVANEAQAGTSLTFTLEPATGYKIKDVIVNDTSNSAPVSVQADGQPTATGAQRYTGVMPAGNVQISATFELINPLPQENPHDINVAVATNGVITTGGLLEAKKDVQVTLYVKADSGYEIGTVSVDKVTGGVVTVTGGSEYGAGEYASYKMYYFTMPDDDVNVNATFTKIQTPPQEGIDPNGAAGTLKVSGTVITTNTRPLEGAKVELVYADGNNLGTVAASTMTDASGKYALDAVPSTFKYTVKVTYDTKIVEGELKSTGGTVPGTQEFQVSSSVPNPSQVCELVSQSFTVALYYDWDLDNDNDVERVYAGKDDKFLTADDFYEATVAGKKVQVYAGGEGNKNIQSTTAYYLWNVDGDTNPTLEKVYVGNGFEAGTNNDYYLYDVDHNPETDDVMVYINYVNGNGNEDATPATPDDYYDSVDVNMDGTKDTVYAGVDGIIATEDDWYKVGETIVFAGEDKIAGTEDDYYMADVDGATDNDGDEKVYVGQNRRPDTSDDFYYEDVDSDNIDEKIFAGDDAQFNTDDDFYETTIGTTSGVKVYPGTTGNDADPYEFGLKNDHYDWTVGGKAVVVRVGEDTEAGTSDDEYDYEITDDNNGAVSVVVKAGEDGVPGTDDDTYKYDVDNDGTDEDVCVGADGIPGTHDDYYDEDVNGDGADERVYAGEDKKFDTSDDWYSDSVAGEPVKVIAGADGHIGTEDDYFDWQMSFDPEGTTRPVFVGEDEQAGTSDDWYAYDVNKDGVNEEIKAGENGVAGTPDDHYDFNADEDAAIEDVFVGADSKPGTSDDYYDENVNGGDSDERVYAGEDEKFKTDDDYYYAVVNTPDGGTEIVKVFAGDDTIFSDPDNDDSDDYYPWDVNGDGQDEKVFIDGDSFAGTKDDYYFIDADGDGQDEKVFVGEDKMPLTQDDYYIEDVNGDGKDETVYPGENATFGDEDDYYPADVNKDGQTDEDEKVFAGEDKDIGSNDDYYTGDPDKDGDEDKIFVGDDKIPATSDDWYKADIDGDGEDETPVKAGDDGISGTEDDTYKKDVDGDGTDEDMFVGDDTKPGTEDDYYKKEINGEDEEIKAGDDKKPGTEDDYYEKDIDGDGEDEEIRAGEDKIPGTKDDEYDKDIDGDGEDEVVYVGDDTKPGTEDDWYYPVITFNAGAGTVNGASTWAIISSDLNALPTASRSGSYSFTGWSLPNSSAILTLEQVLALKVDTTLTAQYRYTGSTGGGGGGGGGGGVSSYTVKFDSMGGSTVKSQSVSSGGTVKEPANPTRSGYTFTGWFTDKACSDEYNFSDKVRKSFTLYAGWEKKADDVSEKVFRYLTTEHIAYIAGFDDGLVHGDRNMTRAQAAMVFYRLLNDDARAKYGTKVEKFGDVPADAWYTEAVATLANIGIICGYPDGNFGPNDPITRAQFAVICSRIGELKGDGKMNFSDVSANHWAAAGIDGAADQGWVVGYPGGTFGPEDYITRSQVVTMLNRVLLRDSVTADSFKALMSDKDFFNWADNMDTSAWDYLALIEAGNGHEYTRDAKGVEIWTDLTEKAE